MPSTTAMRFLTLLLLGLSLCPAVTAQTRTPSLAPASPVFDHDPMSITVGYVPTTTVLKVLPAAGVPPSPSSPRRQRGRQAQVPALAVTDPYNKVKAGVPIQVMVNTSTDAGADEVQVRFYAGFRHSTDSFEKRLQEGTDYTIDAASVPIKGGMALFNVTFLLPTGQDHRKIIIAAWKKSEAQQDDRVTAFQTINVYQ